MALTIEELPHLPHRNNIAAKKLRRASAGDQVLLEAVGAAYTVYFASLLASLQSGFSPDNAVTLLNKYLDYAKTVERQSSFFNWRSDFAATVIPEFLVTIIFAALKQKGVSALVAGRNSVVELTLAGSAGGGWQIRRKDQDICLGVRTDAVIVEGKTFEFLVPICAVEVKTNLDVNKFNGLDFSAERLKRSFPGATYFVVTETVDFSLSHNYVSSSIDEIYVLRKQVRSKARKDKLGIAPEVVKSFVEDIVDLFRESEWASKHVYERLLRGNLIHDRSRN